MHPTLGQSSFYIRLHFTNQLIGWAYADGVERVTGVANDTLLADALEKEE